MNEFPQFDESLLTAYLDNELTDSERLMVEDVLGRSEEARTLLDELQRVRTLVAGLRSIPLTRSFAQGPWNQTNIESLVDTSIAESNQVPAYEGVFVSAALRVPFESSPQTASQTASSYDSKQEVVHRNWRLIASLAASVIVVATIGTLTMMQNTGGRNLAVNQSIKEDTPKSDRELSFRNGPSPSMANANDSNVAGIVPSDPSRRADPSALDPRLKSNTGGNAGSGAGPRSSSPGGYGGNGGDSISNSELRGAVASPNGRGSGGGGFGGGGSSEAAVPEMAMEALASPMKDSVPAEPAPATGTAREVAVLSAAPAMDAPSEFKMNVPAPRDPESLNRNLGMQLNAQGRVDSVADDDFVSKALVDSFFRQAESTWRLQASAGENRLDNHERSYDASKEKAAGEIRVDAPDLGATRAAVASVPSREDSVHRFAFVLPDTVSKPTHDAAEFARPEDHAGKDPAESTVRYRFMYMPNTIGALEAKKSEKSTDIDRSASNALAESESATRGMTAKQEQVPAKPSAEDLTQRFGAADHSPEQLVRRVDLWSFLNVEDRNEHLFGAKSDATNLEVASEFRFKKVLGEIAATPGSPVGGAPANGFTAAAGSAGGIPADAGRGGTAEASISSHAKQSGNVSAAELDLKKTLVHKAFPVIEFVIPRENWSEASGVLRRIGIPVPHTVDPQVSNLFFVATLLPKPTTDRTTGDVSLNDPASSPLAGAVTAAEQPSLFDVQASANDVAIEQLLQRGISFAATVDELPPEIHVVVMLRGGVSSAEAQR